MCIVVGETKLHRTCRLNKVNQVKLLLEDPEVDVNAPDNAGWTPLHEAVVHGSIESLKLLLEYIPPPGSHLFIKHSNIIGCKN